MTMPFHHNPNRRGEAEIAIALIVAFGMFLLLVGIATCSYVVPQYNVYSARQEGIAELAKAESTRQVKVLESKATMDSAQNLADAAIIQAQGVAKANTIIGDSLKNNESYLRYLWIQQLGNSAGRETIYVPTEANLPILEATRRQTAPVAP